MIAQDTVLGLFSPHQVFFFFTDIMLLNLKVVLVGTAFFQGKQSFYSISCVLKFAAYELV